MQIKRVGKFGLVGVLNTLIDFILFNAFIELGFYRISANVFSTTIAMGFSFIANKSWVFHSKQRNILFQAALFFGITAFGLYVIQNVIIFFLTEVWLVPLDVAYDVITGIGKEGVFTETFVINNGAKAIATLCSLIWNYLLYKKIVFHSRCPSTNIQSI